MAGPCVLRLRDRAGAGRLGSPSAQILEREGRYKFLSYANKLCRPSVVQVA